MPAGTYPFLYPRRTLAALDEVGKMHTAGPFRDAVGESGRARYSQFLREAVVSQETLPFGFRPGMSLMPKEFMAADPRLLDPEGPRAATEAWRETVEAGDSSRSTSRSRTRHGPTG